MTLGAPTGVDVDSLKAENEQLRAKVADLQLQVDSLANKEKGWSISASPEGSEKAGAARHSEHESKRGHRLVKFRRGPFVAWDVRG
eukprot:scaffold1141_cov128-Isochrysis_galbana.AAC.8